MQTVIGYITNVVNPNLSGIATVHVRTNRNPLRLAMPSTDERMGRLGYTLYDVGEIHTFHTEAGYGVRQLAHLFDGFSVAGQHTRAAFTIDDMGMLAGVELLEDEA